MNRRSPSPVTTILWLVGAVLASSCAPGDPSENSPPPAEGDLPAEAGVVARVLGEDVRADDAATMQAAILTRLVAEYAQDRGLDATDAEIQAVLDQLAAATSEEAQADLTDAERAELTTMRTDMARSIVEGWKVNRALHQEFGGRVIGQQMGPEPLDAYRAFLERAQEAGDFEILREDWRAAFWRYFTDDSIHDFLEPGSAEEAAAFDTPPWEGGAV